MFLSILLLLVALFPEQPDPQVLLERADSLLNAQSYRSAAETAAEAGAAFREAGDEDGIAEALFIEANAWFRLDYYQLALDRQEACYRYDVASGDSSRISSSLNTLAGISFAMGEYEQAALFNRRAIAYIVPEGPTAALAIRYGMASEIALKRGLPAEAVDFAKKALEIDRAAGRANQTAIRQSQLAGAYIGLEEYAAAEECLSAAIPVLEEVGNRNSLAISLNQRGQTYLHARRPDLASADFIRAYNISGEIGNRYTQKRAARGAALSLAQVRPSEAVAYMESYADLCDTLYRRDAYQLLADMEVRYDLATKDLEIARQQASLENRRLLLILLCVVAFFLLLGLVVMAVALHRRNRRNAALLRASLLKDKLLALHPDTEEALRTIKDISAELDTLGVPPQVRLSSRELQVARLCCEGLMAKEIADRMNISVRTVETHKNNIFHKLGIGTTLELVRLVGQIP